MNDIDREDLHGDRSIDDDRLRGALRGLRRDTLPQHDLWPQIAARIADGPSAQQLPKRRVDARVVGWAMAASVNVNFSISLHDTHQSRTRSIATSTISSGSCARPSRRRAMKPSSHAKRRP